MKFKDWVKKNVIKVEDDSYIEGNYIGIKNITILEITFDILNYMKLLDIVKLYKVKKFKSVYVIAFPYEIEIDEILPIIRLLNMNTYFDDMDKESFKDTLIGTNVVTDVDNSDFYCRFTLNHSEYNIDYISQIEEVLNEDITFNTNLDLLYKEFKNKLKDSMFRSIMLTHLPNSGCMIFNNIEELKIYKSHWTAKENELEYSTDNIFDFDDVINDSDNGKVINIKDYINTNNKLN